MTSWPPNGEQQQFPPPPQYSGYQPGPGNQYPSPPAGNGLAVTAMVLGIVGLLVLGVILGPLAVVFGLIGLRRANGGASGKGMAIAGVILGIIDTVLSLTLAIVLSRSGGFF
ncbi:MAG: hypothetical protein DLM57_15315 [Pseudonocardiales bacterium]|nr:MAG: hypothetical protein DLM57_15315 [Pseudonocardiales bacterium]